MWVASRQSLPRTPTSNRPGQTPTCNDRSKSRNPLGYFALRCLSPFEGVLDERMLRIRGYGSGNFVVSCAAGSFARYLTRPSTISTGRFGFSHAPMGRGDRLQTARLATAAAGHGSGWVPNVMPLMPLTNSSSPGFGELAPRRLEIVDASSFGSVSRAPSNEDYHTTLDVLFVGCRVCVRRKPQTCGEVVRVMPMTGRVVVRLDPPHPSWRRTLRSFRPERLVIYS